MKRMANQKLKEAAVRTWAKEAASGSTSDGPASLLSQGLPLSASTLLMLGVEADLVTRHPYVFECSLARKITFFLNFLSQSSPFPFPSFIVVPSVFLWFSIFPSLPEELSAENLRPRSESMSGAFWLVGTCSGITASALHDWLEWVPFPGFRTPFTSTDFKPNWNWIMQDESLWSNLSSLEVLQDLWPFC